MSKLPEIKMSELVDSSSEDEMFFSPITKPKLIKCEDKDCYFCDILKDNCSGKNVSIFNQK
jgi:hypothetical protein